MQKEVIAIFDLGKINKKFVLYDEQLQPVLKTSVQLPQTVDEDLFPCEDHLLLKDWMLSTFAEALIHPRYNIVALNFSAYGATMVHLDHHGQPLTPLYNYLKPFDEALQRDLYARYGGRTLICSETASPPLGHLNSGLTLYWLQQVHPDVYAQIHCSMHLPEFCSFLFSDDCHSGITSVGCHTHLWNFDQHKYHRWVTEEGVAGKLAPLRSSGYTVQRSFNGTNLFVGMGLHDSSAALIPHLKREHGPFVLLCTGTWRITLNPFNQEPLTAEEVEADCLCYMSYTGKPVKAARYFAGQIHEEMIDGLSTVYEKRPDYFYHLSFDEGLFLMAEEAYQLRDSISYYNLPSAAQAYHYFMYSLVKRLLHSVKLAIGQTTIHRLIVEGVFCMNHIFMTMLRRFLTGVDVLTAGTEEASALGAAIIVQDIFQQQDMIYT